MGQVIFNIWLIGAGVNFVGWAIFFHLNPAMRFSWEAGDRVFCFWKNVALLACLLFAACGWFPFTPFAIIDGVLRRRRGLGWWDIDLPRARGPLSGIPIGKDAWIA